MSKGTEKTPGSTVTNAQPGATKGGKPASPGDGQAGIKIGEDPTAKGGKTK